MANQIIRNEFLILVRSALRSAESVSSVDHAGFIGRAREIFVQKMLRPILPPYVEFGSGKIADSRGNISAETDVIVYSRNTLPPLVFESGFGIYPAEACIYAIEVKSTLTVDEIRNSIEKFRRLKYLVYLPTALNERYQPVSPNAPPVIPLLFAYKSDLSAKDELKRYRELDAEADKNPAIPIFCVAGRGYWWFKPNEPAEKWIKHLPTENNEEVVELIGGIANTIPDQVVLRGRPRFGEYVIEQRKFEKH